MEWKKNFLFGGLAAGTGVFGYLLGRSKSFRGVSLTLMAVSLMLYFPKGCETFDKYIKHKNEIELYKMKMDYRKDSIESILKFDNIQKDSAYVKYSKTINQIDKKYDGIIDSADKKYSSMLNEYDSRIEDIIKNTDKKYSTMFEAHESKVSSMIKNTDKKYSDMMNSYEYKLASIIEKNDTKYSTMIASHNTKMAAHLSKINNYDARTQKAIKDVIQEKDRVIFYYAELFEEMKQFKSCMSEYYVNQQEKRRTGK